MEDSGGSFEIVAKIVTHMLLWRRTSCHTQFNCLIVAHNHPGLAVVDESTGSIRKIRRAVNPTSKKNEHLGSKHTPQDIGVQQLIQLANYFARLHLLLSAQGWCDW